MVSGFLMLKFSLGGWKMHKVKEGVQATDGIYEKVKIWNGSSYQTVYRPMYFQPPPGATIIYGECTKPKKEKL